MYLKFVIFAIFCNYVFAFPDGAPTAACINMTPGHGGPLPFDVPADIIVSTSTVNAGGMVYVTLRGRQNDPIFGDFLFRGFQIQARVQDGTNRVVGSFELAPGVRHVVCPTLDPGSTVTHTNNNDKSEVNMNWRAPTNVGGSPITVRLFYTIAMNVGSFWANEMSAPITVLNH